jgi:hypothetical protein
MPRVHRALLVPQCMKPLPHDKGGELRQLHVQAMAIVFGAQHLNPADPSNPAYVSKLERAIACCEKERAGWLAVRTEQMPAGDKEAAGKSCVALAGFALELDKFGDALRWLARARKELGQAHANLVLQNLTYVLAHVELEFEATLQRHVFKAWRDDLPRRFACCHLHEYGICPGPGMGWLA